MSGAKPLLPLYAFMTWRGKLPSINPWTPIDPYRGRTAPLTSKVAFYIFIQQI
jgi:hypothetical protein